MAIETIAPITTNFMISAPTVSNRLEQARPFAFAGAMWRILAASLAFLGAAHAQTPATFEEIGAEARVYAELPGPYPDTTRPISIWRAPSAPPGPLPTLYMADGGRGLYVAAALIRAEIEAGRMAPIQIIGVFTEPSRRQAEYVHQGAPQYRAHERWWLEIVIPWAEQHVAASPTHRVIGGFSNGADFALAMGAAHPDVFAGVLAHSPVSNTRFDPDARASGLRWAITAGRGEFGGDAARVLRHAGLELTRRNASVRLCEGPWRHAPADWISVSPGSIAWLFGAENHAEIATEREREACRIVAGG